MKFTSIKTLLIIFFVLIFSVIVQIFLPNHIALDFFLFFTFIFFDHFFFISDCIEKIKIKYNSNIKILKPFFLNVFSRLLIFAIKNQKALRKINNFISTLVFLSMYWLFPIAYHAAYAGNTRLTYSIAAGGLFFVFFIDVIEYYLDYKTKNK